GCRYRSAASAGRGCWRDTRHNSRQRWFSRHRRADWRSPAGSCLLRPQLLANPLDIFGSPEPVVVIGIPQRLADLLLFEPPVHGFEGNPQDLRVLSGFQIPPVHPVHSTVSRVWMQYPNPTHTKNSFGLLSALVFVKTLTRS